MHLERNVPSEIGWNVIKRALEIRQAAEETLPRPLALMEAPILRVAVLPWAHEIVGVDK